MSSHATSETLSAYLDQELPEPEARQVEEHLDDCEDCQRRYAGLKGVVAGLRHLERMAPSPTLDQLVARRVRLEGEHKSLMDRLEGGLGTFERQSSLLGLFGLVVALAVMILLFAHALEKRNNSSIPVIFQDPVTVSSSERLELADRVLLREDDVWIEQGVSSAPTRTITLGSAEWLELRGQHPELTELESLDGTAVVRVSGEILRLELGADSSP